MIKKCTIVRLIANLQKIGVSIMKTNTIKQWFYSALQINKFYKLARFSLIALSISLILGVGTGYAVSPLNKIGTDNWPYVVAPNRTNTVALPDAGMPTRYIYAVSGTTPSASGGICDKNTTGIRVYDISKPSSPKFISLTNAPNSTSPNYLKAVHLSSGQNILLSVNGVCQFTTSDGKNLVNNSAQISNGSLSGFDIYDLSDPLNPKLISTNNLKGLTSGTGVDVFVQNGKTYALVGTASPITQNYYFILDISNPKQPVLIRLFGAVANGQLIWPIAVNGFSQTLSNGIPLVKKIGTKQIAFLPLLAGGVVLYDLTDVAGAASDANRFISQMPLPVTDPISNLSPHDANAIAVSDDGKYAAEVENGGNARLKAHYGAATPLLSATEADFTQPLVSGEAFTTVRIPGTAVAGLSDACGTVTPAGTANQMAVISRGTCTFATKANNVAAAGYGGMLLVNNQPLSGAIQMGGGQRTDNFRALAVSEEIGSNVNLVPSGQLLTLDKVAIPFGYTRLWDISNLLQPKIIASVTTPHTNYALPTNSWVFFDSLNAVLQVSHDKGRLIISADSDAYAIYDLKYLNTSTPIITQTYGTGLIPINTSLVNPNEFLGQQAIINFFNTNFLFETTDIDQVSDLHPYTINKVKVLIGGVDASGVSIYADPSP